MSLDEKKNLYEKWGGLVAVLSSLEDDSEDSDVAYFKNLFDRIDCSNDLYELYKLANEPSEERVNRINSILFDQIKFFLNQISLNKHYTWDKCHGKTTIEAFQKVERFLSPHYSSFHRQALLEKAMADEDVEIVKWIIESSSNKKSEYTKILICIFRFSLKIVHLFTDFRKYSIDDLTILDQDVIDYLLSQGAVVTPTNILKLIDKGEILLYEKYLPKLKSQDLSNSKHPFIQAIMKRDDFRFIQPFTDLVHLSHSEFLHIIRLIDPNTSVEVVEEFFKSTHTVFGFPRGPVDSITRFFSVKMEPSKRLQFLRIFFEEATYPIASGYVINLLEKQDDPKCLCYLLDLVGEKGVTVLSKWMLIALKKNSCIGNLEVLYSRGARVMYDSGKYLNPLVESFLFSKGMRQKKE
jgi:hypothetical protein